MTKTVLGSENTQYGFYGTIYSYNSEKETERKWAEAFELLLNLSGLTPAEIRTYLDSRSGRKLADCCNDSNDDVKAVIIREYFKWIDDDLFEYLINNRKIMYSTQMAVLYGFDPKYAFDAHSQQRAFKNSRNNPKKRAKVLESQKQGKFN